MSDFDDINERGLVLVGCGRMGGAMLKGWLARGLEPGAVTVIDPGLAPEWRDVGLRVNADLPADPAVLVLAVKPQMMADALGHVPQLRDTLVVSVAAGTTIATFEESFADAPIVRVMPNTPAAIGQGISALVGNARATEAHLDLAQALMSAVGRVVRLEGEHQMDAVTALSGSGPAYVFHMIEAMAAAGRAEGLPADMALELARMTVAGAGALAVDADEDPAVLRRNVTSPGGTTAAGLEVLMDAENGLPPLMVRTVAAAAERGRALGRGEK
ncbi:pyrroline-5-carboxylate reductase [Paracoccus sp. 1_MG-2023]|uniref:pyrroline-5-carboxylate reductase n=1 Tax=unclassified Paracoccus (in: a-proteobacteria) TaxID=2688777 RepID=UPI001C09FCD0|nr:MULTISPECIES: pyrroline-5-carboxylate reductase [unclassified Paracoccus (in: a-proteobacteria)]MBU2958135.1 pyrroline-5-carboxylate reductase [Paracoccus sp. C2R09]MDO6669279.1 pyrroline-5-carboxylate reductase [Paracoccus sp. 1_MG-2023]